MKAPSTGSLPSDKLSRLAEGSYATCSAEEVVGRMAEVFPWEYAAAKGVREGYTLRRHTLMVLHQYDKYFGLRHLPSGVDYGFFRFVLALHDIGVPHAIGETGDKGRQHEYTTHMVRHVMEGVGHRDRDICLAVALVSGDPIGKYVRGKVSASATTAEIARLAKEAHRGFPEFLDILLTYYQVDAGSYTEDAGGVRSLDHLFEFDRKRGMMRFALPVEAKTGHLTAYARELPHSQWITDHEWHNLAPCGLKTWIRENQSRLKNRSKKEMMLWI